jgi:hypothetical protein
MPRVPRDGERASQFWLTVLGHAAGARWVLEESRMAFGGGQAARAARIQPGDRLFLYTSRGAFKDPTRDEAQLLGLASVLTPVARLREPLLIADREFVVGCKLQITIALPLRAGVPFRPLVARMEFIRHKDSWSAYMRSSLIQLPTSDAWVLEQALEAAHRAAHGR